MIIYTIFKVIRYLICLPIIMAKNILNNILYILFNIICCPYVIYKWNKDRQERATNLNRILGTGNPVSMVGILSKQDESDEV